jgi:hypothetical protein
MFISQVYKYNKWLCAAMILFLAAQLFVNYKRGLVITPFFHYGMYSHTINVEKEYPVVEIEVNGKMLHGADFAPHVWDKILLPIVYYNNLPQSNKLYNTDIKRLMGTMHLSVREENFIQPCNISSFEKWYKSYLETIIRKPIPTCNIQIRNYRFNNSTLQQTDSIKRLPDLCN